jgi:hypothetical protein
MCTAAVALVWLPGCNRVADHGAAVEHHPADVASVGFDLEPLQSGDGSRQWIGIYNSPGRIARFRIDFGAAESAPGNSGLKSGEGTLIPEPGSDSSALLLDLQKALQARTAPKAPPTKTSIPFTYVSLGENLSQKTGGGGFGANPPGNWTALKLIFGEGDRESEMFLHINASTRKGEFSMKDPSYGDLVLAELAKVL